MVVYLEQAWDFYKTSHSIAKSYNSPGQYPVSTESPRPSHCHYPQSTGTRRKPLAAPENIMNFEEWKYRYLARLVDRGLLKKNAQEDCDDAENDINIPSEEAAYDEISYLQEGG